MTVKELRKVLKGENENRIVVLSRDEEGNGYNKLRTWEIGTYKDGEVGADILKGKPCLVLYP